MSSKILERTEDDDSEQLLVFPRHILNCYDNLDCLVPFDLLLSKCRVPIRRYFDLLVSLRILESIILMKHLCYLCCVLVEDLKVFNLKQKRCAQKMLTSEGVLKRGKILQVMC